MKKISATRRNFYFGCMCTIQRQILSNKSCKIIGRGLVMFWMRIEQWVFTAKTICVGEGGAVDNGKNSSSRGGEVSSGVTWNGECDTTGSSECLLFLSNANSRTFIFKCQLSTHSTNMRNFVWSIHLAPSSTKKTEIWPDQSSASSLTSSHTLLNAKKLLK